MKIKYILSIVTLMGWVIGTSPVYAQTAAPKEAETAATHTPVNLVTLAPLIGKWKNKENKESKLTISFEMIANDTVMVETWARNGKTRSLTLYHQDGTDLIATHYCPQGNQPRLRMTADSQKSYIAFAFQDSTNLESIEDNHQHSLSLKLPTATSDFIRTETYLSAKGEDTTTLVLEPVT